MALRIALTSVYGWPEVHRGGERYVHELAAALDRAGHDVRIVMSARTAGHGEILGVPVRRVRRRGVRLRRRYGDVADQVAFGAQTLGVLAWRPLDVWHATSIPDGAAAAIVGRIRPRIGSVFTDHGFPAAASKRKRPDRALYERVVRDIGAYVCVSEAAAAYLRTDYGREPAIVHPGVDVSAFSPGGDRTERPTLLYVGDLTEPRKNVASLLSAVDRLRGRGMEVDCWLCGPGEADALLDAAPPRARAAVTFAGRVDPDELTERYRRAWATVLPSRAESFGMVVVESLACGTPAVVLADGGGPTEIVVAGTGVVAPAATDDALPGVLADACEQALDLARDPAVAARCRTRAEDFDWDRSIVPRLEEVYGDVA